MMQKRIFCFTLFLLIQLLASLAAAAPTVNISDDHALETDLNKAAGDAITTTDTETSNGVITGCCGCGRSLGCNCCGDVQKQSVLPEKK
ncbi:hypothetical protein F4X33_04175 [Candidatus Poribacteria bacterium]|nr:hypothetical protein [Candidatus Poribacteria bacterium]